MEGKEIYFAFGSNMSKRKMTERGTKFDSRDGHYFEVIELNSLSGKMMDLATLTLSQTIIPWFMVHFITVKREVWIT